MVDLRRQPMLATIQIVSTALTIALVMLYFTILKIHTLPIAPESGRDKYLYWTFVNEHINVDGINERSLSHVSVEMYDSCFTNMEYAASTGLYSPTLAVRACGANSQQSTSLCLNAKYCNDGYWRALDFNFLTGRPFTTEESQLGKDVAVVSQSSAERLFGTDEAVGRSFTANGHLYDVVGVVSDVEAVANTAHSDIWLPHMHCTERFPFLSEHHFTGSFGVVMLASSEDVIDSLAAEAQRRVETFANKFEHIEIDTYNQPYKTQKQSLMRGMYEPDDETETTEAYLIIFIMLLVPAINLSSVTHSRLRRRTTEMAIYRTFGATKWFVARELFIENLAITLFAGVLGFALSVILTLCFASKFFGIVGSYEAFNTDPTVYISLSSALRPELFGYTMLFCLVLNVICCIIPIWRSTRMSIAQSFHRQ